MKWRKESELTLLAHSLLVLEHIFDGTEVIADISIEPPHDDLVQLGVRGHGIPELHFSSLVLLPGRERARVSRGAPDLARVPAESGRGADSGARLFGGGLVEADVGDVGVAEADEAVHHRHHRRGLPGPCSGEDLDD